MLLKHHISCLACAALLAGCAATKAPVAPPKPTLVGLMGEAEAAIKAGENEKAIALLKTTAVAYPADKSPWLRIAQVQFECHNYGEAIAHAQQVLERDPDDMVAHSLVAVSGLRVSSRALADLALKNNLTGSVRAEAQDLARLLRSSIGGEIIPAAKPRILKPAAAKMPASKPAGADNPFDSLN